MRPILVSDTGETRDTFCAETVTESAFAGKVSALPISFSNMFEEQFVSQYTSRTFPWALNCDCGGADYPDLFADWEWIEQRLAQEHGSEVVGKLRDGWRRVNGQPPLLPGEYAKMLARRPEMQIAGDWMCVPAVRNLHWRYAVLHSAFLVCKQKVAPGDSMHEILDKFTGHSVVIKPERASLAR